MKRLKRAIVYIALGLIVAAFCLKDNLQMIGPCGPDAQVDTDLEMTMLDVGQGLCIIVRDKGELMVYDGGDRDASSKVVSYVKSYMEENGLDSIDYLVASHYDDDHLNGLVGLLASCEVENIICPDYETDTSVYNSWLRKSAESGAEIIYPDVNYSFAVGDAAATVLGPIDYASERDNNKSLVLKLECGDFSALLTGDAEHDEEDAIMASGANLRARLYVAGHHGSNSSSQEDWLDRIRPEYV